MIKYKIIKEIVNYYKILGVNQHASESQIKQAYFKKAKLIHPDITGHTNSEFAQLNQAYNCLKQHSNRSHYNTQLYSDSEYSFRSKTKPYYKHPSQKEFKQEKIKVDYAGVILVAISILGIFWYSRGTLKEEDIRRNNIIMANQNINSPLPVQIKRAQLYQKQRKQKQFSIQKCEIKVVYPKKCKQKKKPLQSLGYQKSAKRVVNKDSNIQQLM